MEDYIDWSARECGANCAAEVIQASLDLSQTAQETSNYASEATLALEATHNLIEQIQRNTRNTEGQVIQLRIDMDGLIHEISLLRTSIDDSMVPTIDDSILLMTISILSAATICLVSCLGVICYTSYIETKSKNRNKVHVQPKKKKKNTILRIIS